MAWLLVLSFPTFFGEENSLGVRRMIHSAKSSSLTPMNYLIYRNRHSFWIVLCVLHQKKVELSEQHESSKDCIKISRMYGLAFNSPSRKEKLTMRWDALKLWACVCLTGGDCKNACLYLRSVSRVLTALSMFHCAETEGFLRGPVGLVMEKLTPPNTSPRFPSLH